MTKCAIQPTAAVLAPAIAAIMPIGSNSGMRPMDDFMIIRNDNTLVAQSPAIIPFPIAAAVMTGAPISLGIRVPACPDRLETACRGVHYFLPTNSMTETYHSAV